MIKFPSIEGFAHAYRDAANGLTVRPKIKLHGTNGGIRIKGFNVTAQSRNNVLVGSDNAGFAAWVASQSRKWASIGFDDTIIFGEWAGPGIQDTDAVTKIANRAFFIFAMYHVEDDLMVTDPNILKAILPDDITGVHVLPWAAPAQHINYTNAGTFSEQTSALVEEIGRVDPYIRDTFGIEGPGEGLVFMPENSSSLQDFCKSTFKAKCEAHRVKKAAKAVTTKIDVPKDAVDFVLTFVTEPRLKQGLAEACGGDRSPKNTGAFIKWMSSDVLKESKAELEAMGIEFGAVAKFVVVAAREWFLRPEVDLSEAA